MRELSFYIFGPLFSVHGSNFCSSVFPFFVLLIGDKPIFHYASPQKTTYNPRKQPRVALGFSLAIFAGKKTQVAKSPMPVHKQPKIITAQFIVVTFQGNSLTCALQNIPNIPAPCNTPHEIE